MLTATLKTTNKLYHKRMDMHVISEFASTTLVTDRIIPVLKRSDQVAWGNLLGYSHNAKLDKDWSPHLGRCLVLAIR